MRSKILFLVCGLITSFISQFSMAQSPSIAWYYFFGEDESGDAGASVQQTSDEGYIIAGWTDPNGLGKPNVYLVKTDSNGELEWARTHGGSGVDRASSVRQTNDGGYILSGLTDSYGAGEYDVYVIRTDVNGDTLWTRTFGGSEQERGKSVLQLSDGGFIIAGYTRSYGSGREDIYLIRTDSNGDSLWTKSIGGSENDGASCIQQTTDGGFIIAGRTYSFGAGYADVYLVKTDFEGDTLWTRTYGGSEVDEGNFVQQTTDGGYVIVGYTCSFGATEKVIYLIKTDSIGDTLWTQTYAGPAGGVTEGRCVDQLDDGGYILTGFVDAFNYENIYVLRTDSLGNMIWASVTGGGWYDVGTSVQQTTDGGFIVTGVWSLTDSTTNDAEMFLLKFCSETGIEIGDDHTKLNISSLSPNPFSSTVNISYTLPEQDIAEIAVYDLSGRLVETIQSTTVSEGAHSLNWTPQVSIPNGCYLVVLDACGYRIAARCLKLD